MRKITIIVVLLFLNLPASAQQAFVYSGGAAQSEMVPTTLQQNEYLMLNRLKEVQGWVYPNVSPYNTVPPSAYDGLGYPLYDPNMATEGGWRTSTQIPPQFEYPTDYIYSWTGGGAVGPSIQSGTITAVSCTGVIGSNSCDNTGCTAAAGYIVGTTLTVTSGSSCNFVKGQPISAAKGTFTATSAGTNLTVSGTGLAGTIAVPSYLFGPGVPNGTTITAQQSGTAGGAGVYTTSVTTYGNNDGMVASQTYVNYWGTPTIITNTNGNTTTGNYTLNFSNPTIGSSGSPVTIYPGGRVDLTITNEGPSNQGLYIGEQVKPIITASSQNNTLEFAGFYAAQEESAYDSGEQIGAKYKALAQEAHWAVLRDLDLSNTFNNCSTWYTRKPSAFLSYGATEYRNSLTASASSYNSGTDTYSITAGDGVSNWTDKQTVIFYIPANGTLTSLVSLNGNPGVQITGWGDNIQDGAGNYPHIGNWGTLTYDANFNAAMMFGGNGAGSSSGIACGMPPEAFLNINSELGTNPWFVTYIASIDPITDYYGEVALYTLANYPSMVPEFEATDEPWNGVPCSYGTGKNNYYHSLDSNWPANGAGGCAPTINIPPWVGKIGSVLGQLIHSVYGNKPYVVMTNAQTANGAGSNWDENLQSTAYVGTTIPAQVGCAGATSIQICPTFTKVAAASGPLTDISIATYWGNCEAGSQQEVADGYNYYYGNAATQSTIVNNYLANNEIVNTCNGLGGESGQTALGLVVYPAWGAFVANCGGYVGTCSVKHMRGYEGGYSLGAPQGLYGSDKTVAITGANNSSPCALVTATNNGLGAVSGMAVSMVVTSETGGTYWSTLAAAGSLTVGNGTSTSIPLNQSGSPVNCTADDTLNSATLTYTGSETYINALRTASYTTPQMFNLTLLNNSLFVANHGLNPSQFNLANHLANDSAWMIDGDDLYGYWRVGVCSACTISGTTLTLGGTITGLFQPGQTIQAKGITANTFITGSATGRVSGDTVTLTQSSSIGTGENMFSLIPPPVDCSGGGVNPTPQFAAYRQWNGNICGSP